MSQCRGTTQQGVRCRNTCQDGRYCRHHRRRSSPPRRSMLEDPAFLEWETNMAQWREQSNAPPSRRRKSSSSRRLYERPPMETPWREHHNRCLSKCTKKKIPAKRTRCREKCVAKLPSAPPRQSNPAPSAPPLYGGQQSRRRRRQ